MRCHPNVATSPFPRHLRGGRSVPGASSGAGASHLNPQGPPARGSNSVTVPASPSARGEGVRSGVSALPASQLASPGSEVSPLHRAVSQSPGKRGRQQCQSRPGRSPGAARLPTPCNPILTPAPAPTVPPRIPAQDGYTHSAPAGFTTWLPRLPAVWPCCAPVTLLGT